MRFLSIGIQHVLLLLLAAHAGYAWPSVHNGTLQHLKADARGLRWHITKFIAAWWDQAHSVSIDLSSPQRYLASINTYPARLGQFHGASTRHNDDLVLRFNITNRQQASSLRDAIDTLFLDVWEFTEDWVDMRVSQNLLPSLLDVLTDSLRHSYTTIMSGPDLARAITNTFPLTSPIHQCHDDLGRSRTFTSEVRSKSEAGDNVFFREYRPLSIMLPWMRLMQSLFSTHVKMINIGLTYEGREIPAFKVGIHRATSRKSSEPRKTIIVAGGSHAREWVSVSTVNYVAYSLMSAYGKSRLATRMIEEFDWILIPTINPDGYAYTWDVDRLWRKTRQETHLQFCPGVDLDRSWSYMWDGNETSRSPCSGSYAGEEPFTGIEARRLADWAKNETEKNNVEFVGFFDFHSYSQQILYPYSFSCRQQAPTLEDLEELGEGIAKAIRIVHHERYKVAQACEGSVAFSEQDEVATALSGMISSGGSALDWFYHEMRVRDAFQIKLRDKGSYGFLLPKEAIIPTGAEILQAMEYYASRMFEASATTKAVPAEHKLRLNNDL